MVRPARPLSLGVSLLTKTSALLVMILATAGCATEPSAVDIANILSFGLPTGRTLSPDAVVLRISTIDAVATDLYINNCKDTAESICIRPYWFKYRAKVKGTLSGQYTSQEVEFAHAEIEGFSEAVRRDCYVVLIPANSVQRQQFGVPYVATKLVFRLHRSGPWQGG
jgi:hypothetical protein